MEMAARPSFRDHFGIISGSFPGHFLDHSRDYFLDHFRVTSGITIGSPSGPLPGSLFGSLLDHFRDHFWITSGISLGSPLGPPSDPPGIQFWPGLDQFWEENGRRTVVF